MSHIVVSPLVKLAETAVRSKAGCMISLLGLGHDFHRPAVIPAERHLILGVNDVTAALEGLIAPAEAHVQAVIDFARTWDRAEPMLIHCWMGISRSPAAALIAALALEPDQDDNRLARRLRAASPSVTPNARLVELGDAMLRRGGRLVAAVKAIGRGADAYEGAPFILTIGADETEDARR
jgi:predicted protein tyrosine phosphatase